MRKVLLSTIVAVAMTGSAFAADLPSRKEAPVYVPPPPVFSWTGFYGGIEGGVDFLNTRYSSGGAAYNNDVTGGLVGGLLGYNYQINNFVLGLEGDGGGVFGASHTLVVPGGSVNTNSNYFADVRGRLGLAYDRALFYAAGGVAFGDVNSKYYNATPTLLGTTNVDRTGWTIGGGVDYAFTPNWIGRVEYRYTDLGSNSHNIAGTQVQVRNDSNAVLAGFMYKFGAPEPAVVSKY